MTRLLGRGGMGEVWAAADDTREVAIKVLLARAALKPDLVRRFEREARIASAIKSPFVCQLLEVAQADDGAHLLVFEHLSGESLADRLKREQYLPFSEVGPIIDDVLQGLVAAHEAGVVHRDLKPGNIFLVREPPPSEAYAPPSGGFGFGAAAPAPAPSPYPDRRERAKILDFGISKLTRSEGGQREPTLTDFNATLGSFAYMAPEQVRGAARADERADIYSVGAVAFRALSGRLPFEGTTAHYLVAMKLEHQAPSLAEITGEQWPAGVERFLERALERRREERFSSAAEALEVWRSIQPSARKRGPASSPGIVQPPVPPPPRSAPLAPPKAPARAGRTGANTPMPAPTKPVVTVYGRGQGLPIMGVPPQAAAPSPPATPVPPAPEGGVPPVPPARPPMQSYQVVDDNPTEVDGPPTMTIDGLPPEPNEGGRKRKTGRR